MRKWNCPHNHKQTERLIIRGWYDKHTDKPCLIYAKLCKTCYEYYKGMSFVREIQKGTVL